MNDHAQYDALLPPFPADRFRGLQYAGTDEMAAVQNRRLTEHVAYAASMSPYYRDLFQSLNMSPGDIRTPADLKALPFTEKKDLADHSRFQAASRTEIVDICFTSGSTGGPVPFAQTASDLSRLAYNEAVAFAMAGLDSNDILIICTALGSAFMAGLAYFLGGIGLRATVVRGGSQSAAQN